MVIMILYKYTYIYTDLIACIIKYLCDKFKVRRRSRLVDKRVYLKMTNVFTINVIFNIIRVVDSQVFIRYSLLLGLLTKFISLISY